jgi:putative membrane protein
MVMWHMGDGWGWWMVMGWLWMAVFWGIVLWAVYAMVRRPNRHAAVSDGESREPSALEILERRYARGELSDADFEAMRERLGRTAPAPATANGRPAHGDG